MHSTKVVTINIRIKSCEPSIWWRAYFFLKKRKKILTFPLVEGIH